MDKIHKIRSTKGKTTGRIYMVQEETYMKTKNFSSWWCVARYVKNYDRSSEKKKAKERWAIEKPKLDNGRQLRGTFFIEPNDE